MVALKAIDFAALENVSDKEVRGMWCEMWLFEAIAWIHTSATLSMRSSLFRLQTVFS